MEDMPDINQTGIDYFVSASKASLSLIPYAGPFLSEVISSVIPNQRMDRVCKYLYLLNSKLESAININKQDLIHNNELLLLFEKSIMLSSETNSEQKYEYYSEFILNCLQKQTVENIQKERLLSLLGELNEIEIVLLIYYSLDLTIGSKNKFAEENQHIIHPQSRMMNDPIEKGYKENFNKQYLLNMEKMGLIKGQIEVNKELQTPVIDRNSGQIKIRSYSLTSIGYLLNDFIGGNKFKNA